MYSPTQLKAGTSKKMQIKYNRLVQIKEKLGDNSYHVIDCSTGEELKFPVHVDNLREYIPDAVSAKDEASDVDNQISARTSLPSSDDKGGLKKQPPIQSSRLKDEIKSKQVPTQNPLLSVKGNVLNPQPVTKVVPDVHRNTTTNSCRSDAKDNANWFDVSSLLQSKLVDGKKFYLVQWADKQYPPSWEEESSITNSLKDHFDTHFWPSGRRKRNV